MSNGIDCVVTEFGVVKLSDKVRKYMQRIDPEWDRLLYATSRSKRARRVKDEMQRIAQCVCTLSAIAFVNDIDLDSV